MEIKFIKYVKKANTLHFTVDGKPTQLTIDTTPLIPILKASTHGDVLAEAVISHINKSIEGRVDVPYEGSTVFVPALLAAYSKTVKSSGPMTKKRWESILSIDRNARQTYRDPSSTLNMTHYNYQNNDIVEVVRDFVVVTSNRYQITITDSGEAFVNMHGEVPSDVDLIDYARQAYNFLKHVKNGHTWLPPEASPEADYCSVDLISGMIEYRSGKKANDPAYANEVLDFGVLLRNNFDLVVPKQSVKVEKTKAQVIAEIFENASKLHKHLPCEVLRCSRAMKYGDFYYFTHQGLPYEGAECGIVVRLEMVASGRTRHSVEKFDNSPLALYYNEYGITTEVGKHVDVIDFTGMAEDQFEHYLIKQCQQ